MPWLDADTVLTLAGYQVPNPIAGTREEAAVAYAEELIEAYTGALWGASAVGETVRVRVDAKTYLLPVPPDVEAVTAVVPALDDGYQLELRAHGLAQLDDDEQDVPWDAGTYKLTVTRGHHEIPGDVNKAASLLAAHYLGLSDPDRSRFTGLSMGDFGGSMRLHELPVPEAAQLLRRYRKTVSVSL